MSRQSRFDAQHWMLGAGTLGRHRGMVQGGRKEEGSVWGTRVYLWQIHVDIWQNKYNIVKLKNKKKIRDIKGTFHEKIGSIKDRNGMDLIEQKILRRGGNNTQKN